MLHGNADTMRHYVFEEAILFSCVDPVISYSSGNIASFYIPWNAIQIRWSFCWVNILGDTGIDVVLVTCNLSPASKLTHVQYNGGFIPDIIYYTVETLCAININTTIGYCNPLKSHEEVLIIPPR